MSQKSKNNSLHIPLNTVQIDRSYNNNKSKIPSKIGLLNSSNPESRTKERVSSAQLATSKRKTQLEKKSFSNNINRRNSQQHVFDRLNISPCHKDIAGCKNNEKLGFETQKAINIQYVEASPISETDLLKKLLEILEKLDEEKAPFDLDDYKDYLIYRLCRKLKTYMKIGLEETPLMKKEGELSHKNRIINKDVISVHQRIEKSLSNIEMQLEKKEILFSREDFNDSTNFIKREEKKEESGESLTENSNFQESLEEKRAKMMEALKKNVKNQQKIEEFKGNSLKEYPKSSNFRENLKETNLRENLKENDLRENLKENDQRENLKETDPRENLKEKGLKEKDLKEKVLKEKDLKEKDLKENDLNENDYQRENIKENKRFDEQNLNRIHHNDYNEKETQTEYFLERAEHTNVKYPSELLMSSLDKVKKHQLFYEKFDLENEALLKAMDPHLKSNAFNFNTREKSPQSFEDNHNKSIRSPFPNQNNEDFFEEISIFMKTNKKEDIMGKIRNYGYLEKIETRYIEIIELLNEKCSGIQINSHFELMEILANLIRENIDFQNIYLDFKRQILNILIPDLPLYETRSAGEILEMISQSIEKRLDFKEIIETEDFMQNRILKRIYDELGVFLDSEEALMRLLVGMTKDLNDIQYQCKLIAGMLDIETNSDMKEILDVTMTIISKKQDFRLL